MSFTESVSFGLINPETPNYGKMLDKEEKKRQARILLGTEAIDKAFTGFDPAFYDARRDAYINYAMPQLGTQARQLQRSMRFGLGNRGLLNSTVAEQQASDLKRTTAEGARTISDVAADQANQLRKDVQAQKGTLLSQLYQSGDPTMASQRSIMAAANFSQPQMFVPLTNMFANLANDVYMGQLYNTYKPTSLVTTPSHSYSMGGNLPDTTWSPK